ncbi:MAG: cytochrome c biogenesis protein ResB [Tissierellia bacterium]|nr:cytochrome c biogenesis protein ResB [Tissierellia bacterium]
MIKKIGKFIIGFRFAIILFIVIAIYSIIGTVIPQGATKDFYLHNYEGFGNIILLLQFNRVYSSIIYRTILFLFLVNITGCTIKLLPSQIARMKDDYFQAPSKNAENIWDEKYDTEEFRNILQKKGFKIYNTEKGYKAAKNRIGVLGPSVTHLGIIIILLGSFIGNVFAYEGFVNLLPGESTTFAEQGFILKLDDFYLGFRDDGSTEQYYSELRIIEEGKEVEKKKIWVNNPLKYKGINFYQSSYGWISDLSIKDKEGNLLEKTRLRNNEYFFYQPNHLTVYLYGFYPNFAIDHSGQPVSMNEQKNHPHYAVVLYEFNNYVDSFITSPGEPIYYEDLEISFEDSTLYTGITYRRDFGYYFVLIGCLFMFLGLFLSFYFYPRFIIVDEETILPATKQNLWGYTMQLKNLLSSTIKQ